MRNRKVKVDANIQFVTIDVETANPDLGSICQIGIAKFVDGQLVDEWSSLVDPEDYFSQVNISIHGIQPYMVTGQPKFPDISDHIQAIIKDNICVCHTHFDRVAISRAHLKYNLNPIEISWLDSSQIVRMMENPGQIGHRFRTKSAPCSGSNRPVIPIKIGHPFKERIDVG